MKFSFPTLAQGSTNTFPWIGRKGESKDKIKLHSDLGLLYADDRNRAGILIF